MIKKIILFFSLNILLHSCGDKFVNVCESVITVDNNRPNTGDTVLFDSINKFKFSRVNKRDASTLVASFTLPKEHQNKALWVVFCGKARTNFAYSNSSITLAAMSEKGECLVWRAVLLKYYFTDINKWCYFKDSMFLKPNFDGKFYNEISTFGFSGVSQGENFDMDSLKVIIKAKI